MSLQLRPVSGWNSSRQHLPRAESAFWMARAARSWRMAVGSRDQKALGEQSWEPHNNDVATVFAPKKNVKRLLLFCTAVWHARRGRYILIKWVKFFKLQLWKRRDLKMAKARPCSHIKTQDKASKALNPESLAKRKETPKWELHHHGSTFIHPPCWPAKSRLFKLHVTFQPRSTSPSAREGSGLYHILRCAGVVSWCATDTLNIFTSFDHGIHPLKEEDTVFLYGMKPLDTQKCQSKNCPKLTPSNKKKEQLQTFQPTHFFKTLKELNIQICRTSSNSSASCHNSSQRFSFQHAATNACTSSCTTASPATLPGRCSCIAKERWDLSVFSSIKVRKAAR